MTDKELCERLRNRIWYVFEGTYQVRESDTDAHAAADRIEALTAENERLRELLFEIGNACAMADKLDELPDHISGELYSRCIQAGFPRAALEKQHDPD